MDLQLIEEKLKMQDKLNFRLRLAVMILAAAMVYHQTKQLGILGERTYRADVITSSKYVLSDSEGNVFGYWVSKDEESIGKTGVLALHGYQHYADKKIKTSMFIDSKRMSARKD